MHECDLFTKTGSGQTKGTLKTKTRPLLRSDYFRALFLGDFAEGSAGGGGSGGGRDGGGGEVAVMGGSETTVAAEVELDGVEPRTMRVSTA